MFSNGQNCVTALYRPGAFKFFTFYSFMLSPPPPGKLDPPLLWPLTLWLNLPWTHHHLIRWKKLELTFRSLWKLPFTYHSVDRATRFLPFSMNCVNFLHRQPEFANSGLKWVSKHRWFSTSRMSDRRATDKINSDSESDGNGAWGTSFPDFSWMAYFIHPHT